MAIPRPLSGQVPFHVYTYPLVYVGGYPEFYVGGYWFQMLDPFPPDWLVDWDQADDVWIDWDPNYGGYYLYDAVDPNEPVAVNIISR